MDRSSFVTVTLRVLSRGDIETQLETIAQLRIAVFREWPYIYDGDIDYERKYLSTYLENKEAFVVGAYVNAELIGLTTATPLAVHHEEFGAAFETANLTVSDWFYFGESILLPEYRGHGVGRRFFELREREARRQDFGRCTFCAVTRPSDHPLKPDGYRDLDGFWSSLGYRKLQGVAASFSWRDIDGDQETHKPMQFWARTLMPT